jgi:hypothetical protein
VKLVQRARVSIFGAYGIFDISSDFLAATREEPLFNESVIKNSGKNMGLPKH